MKPIHQPRSPARPGMESAASFMRTAMLAAALGITASPGQALAQKPLGVDVSNNNGTVTWSGVKSAGISFAWAKATQGTTFTDSFFTGNMNNGKAQGILMGAYDFAEPESNTPAAEENFFWNVAGSFIKPDGKSFMPMLDMEVFTGIVGATSYTDWSTQWSQNVISDASAVGTTVVKPVIYVSACNACQFNTGIGQWFSDIADYNGEAPQSGTPWSVCSSCEEWGSGVWHVWQYSSSGSIPGVTGNVDEDVFNGTTNTMLSTMVVGNGENAGLVSQSLPNNSALLVNQAFSCTFVMTNNGTITWTNTNFSFNYISGTQMGAPAVSHAATSIAPGQTASYPINFTAPATPGTYTVNFQMNDNQGFNYGKLVSLTVVVSTGNGSKVGPLTVATSVPVGQPFSATVVMTNTGTTSWTTAGNYHLGSESPQDNTTWSLGRVNLPASPIGPGATASFVFTPVAPSTPGTYTFAWSMVQDGVEWFGPTNSRTITVFVPPPVIITQPTNQLVVPGNSAAFTVAVTNIGGPFSYQWRLGGTNISGATSTILNIANAQAANAGFYNVVITNTAGSVTSQTVQLILSTTPFATGSGNGLQGQYYNNTNLTNVVLTRVDPTINFTWTGTSPDPSISQTNFSVQWTGLVQPLYTENYTFYTTTDDGVRLFVNGALLVDKWVDQTATTWSRNIQLTAGQQYNLTMQYYQHTNAAVAQLSWSSPSQILQIIPQTQLMTYSPPLITAQPVGETLTVGQNAGFSVTTTGTPPFTYQWLFNGSPINGAVSSSFNISGVQLAQAGNYSVTISNIQSAITSSNALLTVLSAPFIVTPPQNDEETVGDSASFNVVVGGTPPFSYQWTKNSSNISGATASSFNIAAVQSGDGGNYAVIVSNTVGFVSTAPAVLTVTTTNLPASIVASPTNQSVVAGTTAVFTVSATGTAPLIYQWFHGSTSLTDGPGISGSGTATLTLSNVNQSEAGNYSVAVSNGSGSALSQPASLKVNDLPVLSPIPDQTIGEQSSLSFTATATDPNPDARLTFSLDSGAPVGTAIDPVTGLFTWTPSSGQRPSTSTVTVRVTNNGSPPASAAQSFTINVLVEELPPRLIVPGSPTGPWFAANAGGTSSNGLWQFTGSIGQSDAGTMATSNWQVQGGFWSVAPTATLISSNQAPATITVDALATLSITNSASEDDFPMLPLTFSLVLPPNGMVIDPNTGVITWTPGLTQAGFYTITVQVSDNGNPQLTDVRSFTVQVIAPGGGPVLQNVAVNPDGSVVLNWSTTPGRNYRVQYSIDLATTNWTSLIPDLTASGSLTSLTNNPGTDPQRFYRVLLLP